MRRMSYGIWGSLCLALLISSCDDNEEQNVSLEELIEEVAFAENIFSDVDYEVDEATTFVIIPGGRFGFGLGGCGTRAVEEPENEEYPIVITIDYGEEECDSFRGVSKMGKIIITLTGDRETEGAQRIVTFEDYYVNGNQIVGTRTFTNDGRNDNGNLSYTVIPSRE